jgi:two-component system nitrogen regulation sensor histidine kinase NtrY
MILNRYSLHIVARIILIVLTVILVFIFLEHDDKSLTVIVLSTLVILQTVMLIRYHLKFQHIIVDYLSIIKSSDTITKISPAKDKNRYAFIDKTIEQISKEIQKTTLDKVSNDIFTRQIFDEIPSGMISFDEDGNIQIINKSACMILGCGAVTHLQELKKRHPELIRNLQLMPPFSTKIIELSYKNLLEKFHFSISEFFVLGKFQKVVLFSNIQKEIEKTETESYNSLIRILTHEIGNSLTPITSLAAANRDILTDKRNKKLFAAFKDEDLSDLISNNELLEERSIGILEFISLFSKLSSLPQPTFSNIIILDLFKKIESLYRSDFISKKIAFLGNCNPEHLKVSADYEMLTHVLINLLKNSSHSLNQKGSGEIHLNAFKRNNSVIIQVIDNGPGIESEIMNKIFVPFYTTRESGSGIGLSYSKQVMLLHNGKIHASSIPGQETIFELTFTSS